NASHFHRRAQLELAHVREARLERIAVALPVVGDAGRLRRQVSQRSEPQQDEEAGADLERLSLCHVRSHIKNAVITKSSASVTIEENTTVRVVACATPSLVGAVV